MYLLASNWQGIFSIKEITGIRKSHYSGIQKRIYELPFIKQLFNECWSYTTEQNPALVNLPVEEHGQTHKKKSE